MQAYIVILRTGVQSWYSLHVAASDTSSTVPSLPTTVGLLTTRRSDAGIASLEPAHGAAQTLDGVDGTTGSHAEAPAVTGAAATAFACNCRWGRDRGI